MIYRYSNRPIINKIQSWIIAMQSRHKSITLCWVQSHVNILGNAKADKLAKQAATSNGDYAYTQYPYKDYYPLIKKATFNV